MKKIISKLFSLLYNNKKHAGFFYFLYLNGLKGLQQGVNYHSVEKSGELNVLHLLKENYANPLIIDGGANVGNYSLNCINILDNKCKIIAFEPAKKTFLGLQEKLVEFEQVRIENMALSANEIPINLYYDNEYSPMASAIPISLKHLNINSSLSETVAATSLDKYCVENQINSIALLKLDLEGYELNALKGCSSLIKNNNIDSIQFEFGKPNIDARTFIKDFFELLDANYSIFRIVSYGFLPLANYSHEYEVFHGSNYLAINNSQKDFINSVNNF